MKKIKFKEYCKSRLTISEMSIEDLEWIDNEFSELYKTTTTSAESEFAEMFSSIINTENLPDMIIRLFYWGDGNMELCAQIGDNPGAQLIITSEPCRLRLRCRHPKPPKEKQDVFIYSNIFGPAGYSLTNITLSKAQDAIIALINTLHNQPELKRKIADLYNVVAYNMINVESIRRNYTMALYEKKREHKLQANKQD